jgi:hypothetical protein
MEMRLRHFAHRLRHDRIFLFFSKIRAKPLKSLIWRKEKTRLKQPFPVVLATISAQEALFTCKKTPLSARKR